MQKKGHQPLTFVSSQWMTQIADPCPISVKDNITDFIFFNKNSNRRLHRRACSPLSSVFVSGGCGHIHRTLQIPQLTCESTWNGSGCPSGRVGCSSPRGRRLRLHQGDKAAAPPKAGWRRGQAQSRINVCQRLRNTSNLSCKAVALLRFRLGQHTPEQESSNTRHGEEEAAAEYLPYLKVGPVPNLCLNDVKRSTGCISACKR